MAWVGRFQGQGLGLALGACLSCLGGGGMIYLHANWAIRGCGISEFRGVRGCREFYVIERTYRWIGVAKSWHAAVSMARMEAAI